MLKIVGAINDYLDKNKIIHTQDDLDVIFMILGGLIPLLIYLLFFCLRRLFILLIHVGWNQFY